MLGWIVLTLAGLAYFLNEALRAPVIEQDESDGGAAASPDHASPPVSEPDAVPQQRPVHDTSDQNDAPRI